jgi:hypothetical protein
MAAFSDIDPDRHPAATAFSAGAAMPRFRSSRGTRSFAWVVAALLTAGSLRATAQQSHWAFRKPSQPPVPAVLPGAPAAWRGNPIDAFILQALNRKGLSPNPAADRRTLLRRVTFDLTGLAPEPAEVEAFARDPAPDAYERVAKRLLASPQYGERGAQHWLDVVRFGETNGFEGDGDRPQAWRYRDWVVQALNEDKPYDRFLREQVAGDLLASRLPAEEPDRARKVLDLQVATGFLRAGPRHVVGGNSDPTESRQEWLTEAG